MTLEHFTAAQRQALIDLAMLAIYADGHLASAEDERVQRLLTAMGFSTEYDRGKHFDASVSRVSRHSKSSEAARSYAVELARAFTTSDDRREVDQVLADLVASDSQVAPQESSFLAAVRNALRPEG